MRSSEQLRRKPGEYLDWQSEQRRTVLRALLAELRGVRGERPEWYVWVVEGQPEYTVVEYEALRSTRATKGRRRGQS